MFYNYNVSNVKHLILPGNSFTYINFTTFKTMTGLKEISLANNEISHVTLTRLTSLIILDMSSNLLPRVPIFCGRNDTSYFPNLHTIILSRNIIGFLGTKSFRC